MESDPKYDRSYLIKTMSIWMVDKKKKVYLDVHKRPKFYNFFLSFSVEINKLYFFKKILRFPGITV